MLSVLRKIHGTRATISNPAAYRDKIKKIARGKVKISREETYKDLKTQIAQALVKKGTADSPLKNKEGDESP